MAQPLASRSYSSKPAEARAVGLEFRGALCGPIASQSWNPQVVQRGCAPRALRSQQKPPVWSVSAAVGRVNFDRSNTRRVPG